MSIEKMEFINIAGMKKDIDEVLLKCCQSECFHIEKAEGKGVMVAQHEENPYFGALKRIYSLSLLLKHKLIRENYSELKQDTVEELETFVGELEESFHDVIDRIKQLTEMISLHEHALIQLIHLKGLNVNFEQIFASKHVGIRFGKLPYDSYQKLAYYDTKPFEFVTLTSDKDYYWGLYIMPDRYKGVIDDIFDNLFFERVRVPDFVKGTPDNAIEEITQQLANEKSEVEELTKELTGLMEHRERGMNMVFSKLKFMYDIFELRGNAAVLNDKFYIVGFVPKLRAKEFLSLFDSMSDVSVLINPPELDDRYHPPIKLKNNKFSNPFSMFVEMYGLPSYNGFNPTMLVAITYTLLFGIMFGDLGQGLVVAIVGYIIYKVKKNVFGEILFRMGISSAFFGLIYGSVFGLEEALNPLYKLIGLQHKPLDVFESTNTVLIGAVAIGVILIIVSISINVYLGFKSKDYERALFSNNGVAGLVFYISILIAGVSTIVLGHNLFTPLYIIFLIVIPLLSMFFRVPLGHMISGTKSHENEGIGTFIAENFFELFEFLLSYATNTMSFLRVGGFVLSHAGMMLVVMTLADSVSSGAMPVVVVIGNIFVMGMEGLIVGIQILRLEFYEIFSRFYDGNGHAFKPISVSYNFDNIEIRS